ncbi:MFS transporter [Rhizobium sp. SSA_523]|uniref:MFS transporter n=1 Tax=Rhizobium sp. SSA_523 TaxID=2952477 RepID=UPI002090F830|nr:MFS transporter [Rhizobium sp. SSA_523]MCO5729998.1 MFS transporter [Rhizobium sp. SSA_523]WKC25072.1 MFS transporter [Rhizobium sp. SSA_523]
MANPNPELPAPRRFSSRCALGYAAALGVSGIILPFFPVWLKSLALNADEIGVVLSVPILFRLVTAPLAGFWADRLAERAMVLWISAGLALLSALLLTRVSGFWPVLLIYALQGAAFAPFMPVMESITVTGVRRWGFRYGSIRVWGSVAFVLATLGAGVAISASSPQFIPWAIAAAYGFAVAVGFIVPRLGRAVPPSQAPPDLPAMAGPGLPASLVARLRHGLRGRPGSGMEAGPGAGSGAGRGPGQSLLLLMIGCSLVQSTHGMFYGFSGIHWQSAGFSGGEIGLLWSAGVAAEILFFFVAGTLTKWLSADRMILFGSAVAILRWCIFVEPLGLYASLLLQLSHAFSFGFLHFAIQQKIVETVHESRETSIQGLYFFLNGVFLAGSTLLSGLLYSHFGQQSYYAMALLAAAGLAVCLLVDRRGAITRR